MSTVKYAPIVSLCLALSIQLQGFGAPATSIAKAEGSSGQSTEKKASTTPLDYVQYESVDKTVAFEYPRDWVVCDDMENPRVFQAFSTDRVANIIFSIQDLPKDMTLDAFVKATADDMKRNTTKVSPVQKSLENITMGGGPGQKLTFTTGVSGEDGLSLSQALYIVVKGHKAYMLCSTLRDPVEQSNQAIIDKIVKSVRIEDSILRSIAVVKKDAEDAAQKTQEFKNEKIGLTMQVPSSWKSEEAEVSPSKVLAMDNGMGVSVMLTSESMPDEVPVDAYANKVVELVLNDPERTSKKLEEHEQTINGTVVRKIVMQVNLPAKQANGAPVIGRQVLYLFIKGGRSYGLIGSTVDVWYGLYEPVFANMLKSMRFDTPTTSTSDTSGSSSTSSN